MLIWMSQKLIMTMRKALVLIESTTTKVNGDMDVVCSLSKETVEPNNKPWSGEQYSIPTKETYMMASLWTELLLTVFFHINISTTTSSTHSWHFWH